MKRAYVVWIKDFNHDPFNKGFVQGVFGEFTKARRSFRGGESLYLVDVYDLDTGKLINTIDYEIRTLQKSSRTPKLEYGCGWPENAPRP